MWRIVQSMGAMFNKGSTDDPASDTSSRGAENPNRVGYERQKAKTGNQGDLVWYPNLDTVGFKSEPISLNKADESVHGDHADGPGWSWSSNAEAIPSAMLRTLCVAT